MRTRSLQLADPDLEIAVHEAGSGTPVIFVHGSGMSAATWAPLVAHVPDRRAIALDLPGFGRSDAYSYTGRPLREHAVAQLSSTLDALGVERAAIVLDSNTVLAASPGAESRTCAAMRVERRRELLGRLADEVGASFGVVEERGVAALDHLEASVG